MTTKKAAPKPRKPARDRTPRPVLAMAAPPLDQCVVKIEKLRGAEPNYSITLPGHALPRTVDRALEQYRRLGLALIEVEVEYLMIRQGRLAQIPAPPSPADAAKIQAEVERQAPAVFTHEAYPPNVKGRNLDDVSHVFPATKDR